MPRKAGKYDQIKQRLDDWGAYRRNTAHAVGWNVHLLDYDAEVPTGIQKRNDVYSDPVAREHERMLYEQRRAMTTDTAVTELRPRWLRRLIIMRHVKHPESGLRHIADKMGMNAPIAGHALNIAYDALIEKISMLDYQRFNVDLQKNSA